MVTNANSDQSTAVEWDEIGWAQVVTAVNALEAAWKTRPFPNLHEFVPSPNDHLRNGLLVELIKVDQECCWRAGEERFLEWYLALFPELPSNSNWLRELVIAECWTRAAYAAIPTATELQSRFPSIVDSIDLLAIESVVTHENRRTNRLRDSRTDTSELSIHDTSTSQSLVSDTPLAIGAKFGRFEIRGVLGQGAMGTVYRAYDPNLTRDVALKLPHFDHTGVQETQNRFLAEARSAARIRHPNICPIYEAGQIDDQPYMIMALVEGETLSTWLQRQLPSADIATQIITKLAKALDQLHQAGIVHQDIKPQNILLDEHGEPLLMDFGLSWQAGTGLSTTHEGFVGTPAYMSPEQVQGTPNIDSRSDVFSLGVVFFQLLTGELPFSGNLCDVLAGILQSEPKPPNQVDRHIDSKLANACLKALAKRPGDRYQTAGALACALEQWATRRNFWPRWWMTTAVALAGYVLVAAAIKLANPIVDRYKKPVRQEQDPPTAAKQPIADENVGVAQAIQLDLGQRGQASVDGEVTDRKVRLWYRIRPAKTGRLLLEALTFVDGFEGKMKVFDTNLHAIAEDGNSGPGSDSQLLVSVKKDEIYFVSIVCIREDIGPFVLVASQPDHSPPMEPFFANRGTPVEDMAGDNPADAQAFAFENDGHAFATGSVWPARDEDWFVVTPPESGILLIRPETPDSSLDTLLELYEEDVLLRQHRLRIVSRVVAGKRYLVRIRGTGPAPGFSATGNYVLRFRLLPNGLITPGVADAAGAPFSGQ